MGLVLLSHRIASVVLGLAVISPQVFVSELDADTTIPIGFPGDDGVRGNFSSLWSEDIRLTYDAMWSDWPSIDIGPDGYLHIVWISCSDIGGGELHYMKLDGNGSKQIKDVKLTEMSRFSRFPEVKTDAWGNVHMVFLGSSQGSEEVFYLMLDNNGNVLIDSTRVSFVEGQTFFPSIDTDSSNNVHIVWREGIPIGGQHPKIYYTKINPYLDDLDGDGADYSTISVVNNTVIADNGYDPRIAVDLNNNSHVSFTRLGEIFYKMMDSSGNPLIDSTRITYAANASDHSSIEIDSTQKVHIAWRDRRLSQWSVIFYSKLDPALDDQDGDEADESVISLVDDFKLADKNRSGFPSLTVSTNDETDIIWADGDLFPQTVYRSRIDRYGNLSIDQEPVTQISYENAIVTSHKVDSSVNHMDQVYIVWWDNREGQDEIYLKYSLNGQSGKPIADAGGPYVGFEGSPVEFNASNSSGPPGSPLEYRWDFDGNGVWDTSLSNSPIANHTWYDDYTGTAYVEVQVPGGNPSTIEIIGSLDGGGWVIGEEQRAQSFVATFELLTQVSADVSLNRNEVPNAPLTLSIRSDINGSDLTSVQVKGDGMPVGLVENWVIFDVPDIDLTPGNTYWVVLYSNADNYAAYEPHVTLDVYPNGTAWGIGAGGGWVPSPTVDFRMIISGVSGTVSAIDGASVTVHNVAPTPEWTSRSSDGTILNPPYPEGKEILFEATVYDPGIYDTFTYDWDLGDGTILLDAGPSVTHTYGDDDIYIVVLTVTDDDGGVGIDDTPPLDTTNENPVTSIDMPFCIFTEGTSPCEAIGEFTDPGWLDTHSAVWDYGDGTYETAVLMEENNPPDATGTNITSHIYGDDGVYNLTFTVVDDDGGVGTAWAEAQVQNLPPSLDMIAPSSVNEGEDFVLGITATDPGSDDLTVVVDWGDGTSETVVYYNNGIGPDPPNSGEGVYPFTVYSNLTHIYGDNGNFTIQVTVEDDDGGSVQEIVAIEVLNLPPQIVLLAVPLYASEGEEFSLNAEATDQGSDDIQFIWTLELGPSISTTYYNNGMGPDPPLSPWGIFPFVAEDTVNHTYGDNGYYNVSITATDDDGGVSTSVFTIEIRNVEPSIDVGGPYAGDENSPIEFTAAVTDPGSDDLTLLWDWGDGTTDAIAFYNDGVNTDPPKSPWGTYPFDATHTISHIWGDNGDFTVTLTVMDDDGGITVEQTVVTVNNVAPTIESIRYYLNASFAFRIAGEKWHDVEIHLYEDGTEVGYANITRYPGSPNDQMVALGEFSIDFSKTYSAVAYYTPEDDPVNGQIWGATPAWVILEYEDGEERIHHTFNVRHEDTWTWVIDDLSAYFLGHNITFMATASDPGSDDLTFTWDWGDGNSTENVYYNDGIGPDPYPSPEVNPITVTDTVRHGYALAGTYMITLTVTDDDGGVTSYSLNLTL